MIEPRLGHQMNQSAQVEHQEEDYKIEQDDDRRRTDLIGSLRQR